MLKEAVLTTLSEAVAVEGYKTVANEISMAKTTLWRILTKGVKPNQDQKKKIMAWFSGHPRKDDVAADGPAPKTETPVKPEKPVTEAELLRKQICKEVSCITSVSTLQTISLILSRREGMTVTIKLQNGGPR